ncbi:Uncharacterised protein [Mycobacteroides abscessus subsp. abscessus]|nr:Uncharacterised protein [Mycobacteroides abscessus subsp. abscessus]
MSYSTELVNDKYHRHSNGGGLVADSAYVEDSVYVSPTAIVGPGSSLKGNYSIEGDSGVFGLIIDATKDI